MILGLSIFLFVLFIVTMIMTFHAFKQQDEKVKMYKEMDHSFSDELRRSHEYEATSIKKYLPIQIWIYAITTVLTLILVFVYLYK